MKSRNLLFGFLIFTSALLAQDIKGRSEYINITIAKDKPQVVWLNPSTPGMETEEATIELSIGLVGKSPIAQYSIMLNGVVIGRHNTATEVDPTKHNYDKLIRQKVVLAPGENMIMIAARSLNGESVSQERKVVLTLSEDLITTSLRKDYALMFAIDDYDSWRDLNNPVFDATAIKEELEKYYNFETELVINPTVEEILIKVIEYTKKHYEKDDQLFIFFAGHGQFDEILNQGFLVGKDSKTTDPTKSSYLSHTYFRELVDNIPNRHIFVSIDACFGGTFDPTIARSDSRGFDDMYNDIPDIEFINRKLQFTTRKYLTSGGKEYVADGIPGRHSPFTSRFLEALRSYGGKDKFITIAELLLYMEKLEPQPRSGSFGKNQAGSDFIFIAK